MFLWHFNGDSYWTREEPGAAKCVTVMPQKPGVRKHQRVEKKAVWSLPLTYQPLLWVAFALLLRHITQKGEFRRLPFDWYVFSSPPSHSRYFIYFFCCFFSLPHQDDDFLQKEEVVISPYSTSHTTLVYSGEWGVWWKPASSEKIGCRQAPHFPPSSW